MANSISDAPPLRKKLGDQTFRHYLNLPGNAIEAQALLTIISDAASYGYMQKEYPGFRAEDILGERSERTNNLHPRTRGVKLLLAESASHNPVELKKLKADGAVGLWILEE